MDSNSKRQSLASLSLYSRTLSVDELKLLVPFPPEGSREKGASRGRHPSNVQPHSVVVFESHVSRSEDLRAHIEDLLTRLAPAKDAVRAFADRARSEDFQSPTGLPSTPVILRLFVRNTDGIIGLDVSNDELKAIFDLGAVLALELETEDDIDAEEVNKKEPKGGSVRFFVY